MITVACVLVRGYVNYKPEYVFKLRSMLLRHLNIPHRFMCLTDQTHNLPGITCHQISTPDGYHPWWAKIRLFDPNLFEPNEWVLYFDLDVLIIQSLGWVQEYQNFTLIPHAGSFKGCGSLLTVPRYNSSCMIWTAEQGYHLYNDWSTDVTKRLWGDQDWIGERMPKANKFPLEWFPRLSEVKRPPFPEDARVILTKKPKNHVAAKQWPWFSELWR